MGVCYIVRYNVHRRYGLFAAKVRQRKEKSKSFPIFQCHDVKERLSLLIFFLHTGSVPVCYINIAHRDIKRLFRPPLTPPTQEGNIRPPLTPPVGGGLLPLSTLSVLPLQGESEGSLRGVSQRGLAALNNSRGACELMKPPQAPLFICSPTAGGQGRPWPPWPLPRVRPWAVRMGHGVRGLSASWRFPPCRPFPAGAGAWLRA